MRILCRILLVASYRSRIALVTTAFDATQRNAQHRTALQFRRYAAGTCGLAETYNVVLIACHKLLHYRLFFATFLSNRKTRAVRCVAL